MAALAKGAVSNPVVNHLAFNLYDACDCQRCLECVVTSIDQWTRDHYQYVQVDTEDTEVLCTPAYDIQQIAEMGFFQGDCAIVSVFVASLFKALGITTRYVAIKVRPEFYGHVFVECLCADKWIMVDCTVPPDTVHQHYGRLEQYV